MYTLSTQRSCVTGVSSGEQEILKAVYHWVMNAVIYCEWTHKCFGAVLKETEAHDG